MDKMKSYQMISLKILFVIIILCACKGKNENIEINAYSADACDIIYVRDAELPHGANVIGYKFICDKIDTIKEISLVENNPWRHVDFSSLPDKNPYIHFGSNFNSRTKQGFIYYDLKLSSWDEVNSKFKVKSNQHPDSLLFTYANIDCRSKPYLPDYVLTNYWLSVTGVKDSLQLKNRNTFFLENQIKLYSANGDTVLDLISNEYVSTDAQIDSTHTILLFRTWRRDSVSEYSGFEIYKIADDSMLYKFEKDSNYAVYSPILSGNYAVFEVKEVTGAINTEMYQSDPYQTIVYDISKNVFYEHMYPKNYKYQFPTVVGHYLIYVYGDDELVPVEYDSLKIDNLSIMTEFK